MDRLLMLKSKLLTFIQNNYLVVIIALVIFLLFIPIIIFLNISSQNNTTQISPTPPIPTEILPPNTSPTGIPESTATIHQEQTAKDSGPINFVESSHLETDSIKESLPDGSTKYTMESLNPNRSDIIIVKNGSITFMRYTVVGEEISDGYKNLHGKQTDTLPGPTFYGTNTVIYFYEDGGTALTVDPKTGTTYEEFTFQPPISVEEFNKNYRQYVN